MATAISQLRLVSKWSTLRAAAAKIVSEIYFFRTRTGKYNLLRCTAPKDMFGDEENDDEDNAAMAARTSRLRFISTVKEIFSAVSSSEMKDDALQPVSGSKFTKGSETLQQHVEKVVLKGFVHNPKANVLHRMKSSKEDEAEAATSALLNVGEGADFDDFVSPISTEAYLDYRVMPNLKRLEYEAPRLSSQLKTVEMVTFFLASLGALLAALDARRWVPVTVALGAALTNLNSYMGFSSRLEALNASIAEIQNTVTHWCGMTIVDRRMPIVKEQILQTIETSLLSQATAQCTGAAAMRLIRGDMDLEESTNATNKGTSSTE
eukprot:gnl/MRDRNA2_/MRDRNA2_222149_c0_seq1.p1 gnl/MRDRNA2_/MRDRNA2_222149_c0~~gnl/MRDRNA2_/MRDRNA2_222149_c0_seq1.p1  ORF type:complete len:377 (-),score=77.75 gnl/MRDRNA2_/MRDRNA2_222149_c0_seq1:309-1271(-)